MVNCHPANYDKWRMVCCEWHDVDAAKCILHYWASYLGATKLEKVSN